MLQLPCPARLGPARAPSAAACKKRAPRDVVNANTALCRARALPLEERRRDHARGAEASAAWCVQLAPEPGGGRAIRTVLRVRGLSTHHDAARRPRASIASGGA